MCLPDYVSQLMLDRGWGFMPIAFLMLDYSNLCSLGASHEYALSELAYNSVAIAFSLTCVLS